MPISSARPRGEGRPAIPRPVSDPHDVVPPRLERLIQRGQRTGDFDPSLPAAWLADAVIGLQHTAAAQVATGRLTTLEAEMLCLKSTLRLCGGEARQVSSDNRSNPGR
jgi:hypothetical protein